MDNWYDGVPAPVDRDGNVVPLTTRKLYDEAGRKFEVSEISLVYYVIGECQKWRVRRPNGLSMTLDLCSLECSDSLERLADDLARYDDNKAPCDYFGMGPDKVCDSCPARDHEIYCAKFALNDVARRVRALSERNAKGAN